MDEASGAAGNPWRISFAQGLFNMATDSALFLDSSGPDRLPLYEAKMIHQFDHRFGTYEGQTPAQANLGTLPRPSEREKADPSFRVLPKYWVPLSKVEAGLDSLGGRDWLLGWRDITYVGNERTVIASVLPRVGVGHNMPLVLSPEARLPFVVANLNSFVLDWQARQKVGGNHLTFGILNQLPLLAPGAYDSPVPWGNISLGEWLRPYLAELVFTAGDVRAYASDLGYDGPPFMWSLKRRDLLRGELDAAFFQLYGIERQNVDHIMDSFWVVRERDEKEYGSFKTKELILDAYDAMADATPARPFVSRLAPVPAIRPRQIHRSLAEPGAAGPVDRS